ncbi:unnamed protein product [Orchesella dallaii]|uniref:GPI mannosyltransferase 2 n=1 Tax=Orchesella dallaii TaxID=48710 RepID=A0ABP1QEC3_9HEXA
MMMEYRSKRLQNTRHFYGGSDADAPTQVDSSKNSKPKQVDNVEHPPLQQKAKFFLQLQLSSCLSTLYAWISSPILPKPDDFSHATCQQQQHEDRMTDSSYSLYSSDSDNSAFETFENCGGSQRLYGPLNHADSHHKHKVSGHPELPLINLIDSISYFWTLYRTNYSAFVEEFSSTARNVLGLSPGTTDKGWVTYGHNINPKKSRPQLVKRGIKLVNKNSFLKTTIMTRVSGDAHKRWVLMIAFVSRLLIFLIQFATINLPQYFRHNNDGFKFTPEKSYGKLLDEIINSTFGGYVNWDANYFLHISVYGYTSENMLAFFPLLPMVLFVPSRIVSTILSPIISLSSVVIVMGVLLNTWLFVKCAGNVYELAKKWANGSQPFITTACLMFCFNPASIFFSGLYTETMFAYLTSEVILSLFNGNYWSSILCAAMSALCRSNGLLNVGFILAFALQKELSQKDKPFSLIRFMCRSFVIVVISAIPFALFQGYGVHLFCQDDKMYDPNNIPLYCSFTPNSRPSLWTLPYSYVQKKYWNVGFMTYFQLKQVPNFILAAPVLTVLGRLSWSTFKLAFNEMKSKMTPSVVYECLQAAHGLFLTLFCFFFVHVQVSTRMIMSACPYLYLYLASSHEEEVEKFRNHKIYLPIKSLAVTLWCMLYYLIGTVGFSLGLPWT